MSLSITFAASSVKTSKHAVLERWWMYFLWKQWLYNVYSQTNWNNYKWQLQWAALFIHSQKPRDFFFNSIKLCKKSLVKYKIGHQRPHISYKVAFLNHLFTDNTIVLDKYWNISIFSKYKQQIIIRIYIIILFHLKGIFWGSTLSLLENTAKTFYPLITPIYFPCL